MKKYSREPINTLTHLIGVCASFIGLLFMIFKIYTNGDFSFSKLTSAIVFGLSLILLYTASSVYHLVISSEKVIKILRRLDHSMIFVLIAGTYTPICLLILTDNLKIIVLTVIWTLAILGIILKMVWFNSPRWLFTSFYIIMGWLALTIIVPLYKSLFISGVLWLLIGGILYTIGGVIYGIKLPNFSKEFGFHELFHIFVLLGSLSHFYLIYNFIL